MSNTGLYISAKRSRLGYVWFEISNGMAMYERDRESCSSRFGYCVSLRKERVEEDIGRESINEALRGNERGTYKGDQNKK